jgi:tetratricopeptide (TPR) repeat protein
MRMRKYFTMMLALGMLLYGPVSGRCAVEEIDSDDAVEMTDLLEEDLAAISEEEAMADQEQLQNMFLEGYEEYSDGHYLKACTALQRYLSVTTPDDEDNEWATFFFGISLKKAGFSHAAVDVLANLVTRKPNTKIVKFSLELLEEISRTLPFDEGLLIETAVCDESYDFIEGDIADFVNYYQGEYDWDRGLFTWGEEHFATLKKGSYYYCKYLFENGLRQLYAGNSEEAVSLFKEVLAADAAGADLKNDARKTLARLYYEMGNFTDADFLYHQIDMNIMEQAQNLLERAWVHYRMGNAERAMGLLYSFEAPSFKSSFTPEFYILKSFIYKDVCHYRKAMTVLGDFSTRYGEALSDVYERRGAGENEALLLVILNKPRIKKIWNFLTLLEGEQSLCGTIEDPELSAYLETLYRLKQDEVEHRLRRGVENVYEAMANDLLQFEEEAYLMEYEIGLDMYQRVSEVHYSEDEPAEDESETSGLAVYEFQGEFWNDELDNYTVTLPDKCQDAEEWDIFFK